MPSPKACIKNYVLRRPHMNYARIVSKLREQIIKFSEELHTFILLKASLASVIIIKDGKSIEKSLPKKGRRA